MIQLSFQPAFDPLNGVFRLLRMLPTIRDAAPLEIDHVRILDFYLLYPYRLVNAKLRNEDRRLRSLATKLIWLMPYGSQPDAAVLLERMRPIQEVAMQSAVSSGFLHSEELKRGLVLPTAKAIPSRISDRIDAANEREQGVMELIRSLAFYDLRGSEGLKARTRLMEYRYDPL